MADKKLKKKYQQAPKEKKYALLGLPFVVIAMLCMIPIAIGVGIIPCLIVALLCFVIFILIFMKSKKVHKKWVEEGNKEYRYYDPDTGEEVDENGNPLPEGGEAPQNPAPVQEPQIQEPDLPEPDENGDIEEPAPAPATEPAPQPQPQPQAQPQQRAKYEAPYIDFIRTICPIAGFGLFAIVALLRTIMFIRDMVYYIEHNAFFINHILNAIRIIGSAILLAVIIISMVKYFKEKRQVEKGFVSLLKIAYLSAIIGIVGLVYQGASFLANIYEIIEWIVDGGSASSTIIGIFVRSFVIILFYVIFDIALIVFYGIALKNRVNSIKNKIFAVMPLGIMFVICIMFMIVTSVTMPGMAPGYYVTASIIMLACAVVGIIPFFVPFKDEPLGGDAVNAPAAVAPVAAAPVAASAAPAASSNAPQPKNKKDDGDPEVKSNKKGLIIILIVVAALVLCGGGGVGVYFLIKNNQNNQHHEDEEWEDDDSRYYSSSKSSSSSSRSSSRSSSSSKSSSSSASTYTPEGIIKDVVRALGQTPRIQSSYPENYNYWLGDDGYYYTGFNLSVDDPSEAYLYDAVVTGEDFVPSYMVAMDSIHSGQWPEGLNGYFHNYKTSDGKIKLEMGSYYYDGRVACQYAAIYL